MAIEQGIAFTILGTAMALFVWGRWRYDLVAVLALLAAVLSGIVPFENAFAGFAHPAVVTVAAVLILSRALQNAGIVDAVASVLSPLKGRENFQIATQTIVVAVLSAFMNNVGALALMLPVALRSAYREGYPPAKALMPLAFGSLLGGLTTLIGTPPNIIIATFRERETGLPFGMFDFAPVGAVVAAAGVLFVVLAGWRLIPRNRKGAGDQQKIFEIDEYVAEAEVPKGAKAVGLTVGDVEALAENEVTVAGLIRGKRRRLIPSSDVEVREGDILILEGDPADLKSLVNAAGLKLEGSTGSGAAELKSDEVDIVEAVVTPHSRLLGRTAGGAQLRRWYRINVLAVARHGRKIRSRLSELKFQSGDVLLLQGPAARIYESLQELRLLPLAERSLDIGRPQRLALAVLVFGGAIAATVMGAVPVYIAFVAAAALMMMTGIVRMDEAYDAVDWPVIILLGAMIPVGAALESTGGAGMMAGAVITLAQGLGPVWVLLILLVATMFLSDIINNNATAVLMAPIGLEMAQRMQVNADPFLMAVAVGASCAFLTPIGHQSNTLVMEAGGYRFGDYWRMGLPLEAIITAVAVPMILIVWPL
jgi:di/tricarboxylate transporter